MNTITENLEQLNNIKELFGYEIEDWIYDEDTEQYIAYINVNGYEVAVVFSQLEIKENGFNGCVSMVSFGKTEDISLKPNEVMGLFTFLESNTDTKIM